MSDTTTNKHVREFLQYYAGLSTSPEYAVLVDGKWGSGKTHIVRTFVEELRSTGKTVLFVSLYGTSSTNEVDDALMEAVYPLIGNKYTKLGGKIIKSAATFFGGNLEFSAKDLPIKVNPDLFVFDDVERSKLDAVQILGYINAFVEQDGAKVILIANQDEISSSDAYRRTKEKVVGRTIFVSSNFSDAFDYFVGMLSRAAATYFGHVKSDIETLYFQFGLDNLRILKQSILDFERLYNCLSHTHLQNEEALRELTKLFIALSLELKAGRLQ